MKPEEIEAYNAVFKVPTITSNFSPNIEIFKNWHEAAGREILDCQIRIQKLKKERRALSWAIAYESKKDLLTEEQASEIVEGINPRELAEKFGVSESVIVAHARHKCISPCYSSRESVIDWNKVDWSKSNKEIAFEYLVKHTWVKKMRSRCGPREEPTVIEIDLLSRLHQLHL